MSLRTARRLIGVTILALSFVGICLWLSDHPLYRRHPRYPGPNNSTLGFGAIYVLTDDVSTWRYQGLKQAAKYVGLELQPFEHRHPSVDEVREQVGGEPENGYGSTYALLGHMAILDSIARSKYETVLVLEDDADTSIAIRSQMQSLSQVFWNHTTPQESEVTFNQAALHPYQDGTWDILWLGHYGMEFAEDAAIAQYHDEHALPWSQLTSPFNDYYAQMASSGTQQAPAPQQLVSNVAPLATFAYGVTRTHAARLVQKLRQDRAHTFDTALHVGCKGLEYRCVAPVPGLFHHHRVDGETSVSSGEVANGERQDMSWYRGKHKYTYNIEWSARCNAARVGEKVGNRWQCMPGKHDQVV